MDELCNALRYIICLASSLALFIRSSHGLPVDFITTYQGTSAESLAVLVAALLSVTIVAAFIGCVCCHRRNGFKPENEKKVFRDSPVSASVICETGLSDDPGHVNPIASSAEFTIFTPLSPSHHNNNVFRLSEHRIGDAAAAPRTIGNGKDVSSQLLEEFNLSSWFGGPENNFPRSKLKYIRELGTGWFGRVVEGEARCGGAQEDADAWTRVAVRILEPSASSHEQSLFLREAALHRPDGSSGQSHHPHLLRMLGFSLEAAPFLVIQEFCPRGDLKNYLRERAVSGAHGETLSPPLPELLLKFCWQLTCALQYLHDCGLSHADLAARNCQLSADVTLKLGDYGLSVSRYPEDYYQGVPAVPVRWCAPETLRHTDTILQPRPMTCEGNIWSLGVTMWEICELGSQPYGWLSDDEVVSQVLGPPHLRLPIPVLNAYYVSDLYRVMQLTWSPVERRPVIHQVVEMLRHQRDTHLKAHGPDGQEESCNDSFDSRWMSLHPNKTVEAEVHVHDRDKSASLTNLHGSLDNLLLLTTDEDEENERHQQQHHHQMDSWLLNVASHTDDMQYVEGLSRAIQALDSALAQERTGSSSEGDAEEEQEGKARQGLSGLSAERTIEFRLGTTESGSETEDETWHRRIERGAYSEQVRIKSKSVTDLMVLTHIDCSDTDSETPLQSLEMRQGCQQGSYKRYGSEGNLLAVQDAFQQELRKMQEERRDSLLFIPAGLLVGPETIGDVRRERKRSVDSLTKTDSGLATMKSGDPSSEDSECTSAQCVLPRDLPPSHSPTETKESQGVTGATHNQLSADEAGAAAKLWTANHLPEHITNLSYLEQPAPNVGPVFNVFSVTVGHTNPIDLYSPDQVPVPARNPNAKLPNDKANDSLVESSCDTKDHTTPKCTNAEPKNGLLSKPHPKQTSHTANGFTQTVDFYMQKRRKHNSPLKLSEIASRMVENCHPECEAFPSPHTAGTHAHEIICETQTNGDVDFSNDSCEADTTRSSPPKLSEIILRSLPGSEDRLECERNEPAAVARSPLESSLIIEMNETNPDVNNDSCGEDLCLPFRVSAADLPVTSTPCVKKNVAEETRRTASRPEALSFVTEGDEDLYESVILGPCEDHMLDLYSSLKTTFHDFRDATVEEDDEGEAEAEAEALQFSSNFMPLVDVTHQCVDDKVDLQATFDLEQEPSRVDYSLETWDRFLGNSFDRQKEAADGVAVLTEQTFDLPAQEDNVLSGTFVKDSEVACEWEPGEGWFLHPQLPPEELSGQMDGGASNVAADTSDTSEDAPFHLDDECVNALRTELAAKLPHAQRRNVQEEEEEVEEEDQEIMDWDLEERNEIVVKYNVYATPLSPIPEESCCEESRRGDDDDDDTDSDESGDWSETGRHAATSHLDADQAEEEEEILVVDLEDNRALMLESPTSLQEPQRHTPSQDSCCSNDTLFNLDDLNFGTTDNEQQTVASPPAVALPAEETDREPPLCLSVPETEPQLETDPIKVDSVDVSVEDDKACEHDTSRLQLSFGQSAGCAGVAPLPSPEDIPWRQLPASLLTYSQVAHEQLPDEPETETEETSREDAHDLDTEEACSLNNDLYSTLTDIRFSGPCDMQLMSTSFSESNECVADRDWDSGSDTRSTSSSGEFIWKEGEHEESLRALHAAANDARVTEDMSPLDAIEEEERAAAEDAPNNNNSDDSDNDDDDEEDGEEDVEESEFVPSAWDAQATPTKSALRSPEKKSTKCKNGQKGVWFKKQKYHCVYEYPREPESPVSHASDLWKPFSYLSTYSEWEIDKLLSCDLYHQLPAMEADNSQAVGTHSVYSTGQVSQFFPGREQEAAGERSWDCVDNVTPDSGVEDVVPVVNCTTDVRPVHHGRSVQSLRSLASAAAAAAAAAAVATTTVPSSQGSLGGLRHTRNKLKLDLPPSPSSFTAGRTFSVELADLPPVSREVPTFTTFGKTSRFMVQHVLTPTDDDDNNDNNHQNDQTKTAISCGTSAHHKVKNVSFEALPHRPVPLPPPPPPLVSRADVGPVEDKQQQHRVAVEIVRGEASLLDSADEDSGIESSTNATLERPQLLN